MYVKFGHFEEIELYFIPQIVAAARNLSLKSSRSPLLTFMFSRLRR